MSRRLDGRFLDAGTRTIGVAGGRSSSTLLCWLATHRDRLRTLCLGGKRLSVLVIWDARGSEHVDQTGADINAIHQLVYGYPPANPAFTEPLDDERDGHA